MSGSCFLDLIPKVTYVLLFPATIFSVFIPSLLDCVQSGSVCLGVLELGKIFLTLGLVESLEMSFLWVFSPVTYGLPFP